MPPSSHDTADTPSGRRLVVAVDGPSGSGKSSVSREVARRLGLRYLDTGAMYRALTWWAIERGADLDDQPEVARLARELPLEIGTTTDSSQLTVDGHDVSAAIREPRISAAVSAVATNLGCPRRAGPPAARDRVRRRHRRRGTGHHHRRRPGRRHPGAADRERAGPAGPARPRGARQPTTTTPSRRPATTWSAATPQDSTVADFPEAGEGVTVVDSSHLSFEETVDAMLDLVSARR